MSIDAEQSLRRTRALVEAARLISASGHDLDAVLDTLTEQAWCLLGGDGGALHLADQDGKLVVRRPNPLAAPGSVLGTAGSRFVPGPQTQVAIATRRPVVAGDFRGDAQIDPATKKQLPTVATNLVVPLFAGDDLVAVLRVGWTRPHDVTTEDLEIVEALGAHAAIAIQTARLIERTRAGADRTARTHAVTAELARALTLEDVTAVVVREGSAAMQARAGLIALLTADRREIEIVTTAGYPDAAVQPWQRFPADAPVPLADVTRSGHPVFIESAAEVISRYPALAATQEIAQNGALAALPLTIADKVIGALGLSFAEDRRIEPEERQWMVALAQRCALALDRARLYEEARRGDERYRLIAETASVAIWERNLDSDTLNWSGGGLAVFGYAPDATTNRTWWQARLHPDDHGRVRAIIRAALRNKTEHWAHEFRLQRADGSYAPCVGVVRVVRDQSGTSARLLGMVMDLTRIRDAEADRDRLADALVRAEERQRMAMDLHDGVIQHLFGAAMLLQGLQRRTGALSDDARDALQTAVAAVNSAHSIVRSYMEALRSPVLPQASLGSQLEALAQDLRLTMGLRVELRLVPVVENLLHPEVVGEVLQIAREAAANAVRHGKATELRMRARRSREQFLFVLNDNGTGFRKKSSGPSPGHGLANMAERARRLGGVLRVNSTPGKGTEVRFELPLVPEVHGNGASPTRRATAALR